MERLSLGKAVVRAQTGGGGADADGPRAAAIGHGCDRERGRRLCTSKSGKGEQRRASGRAGGRDGGSGRRALKKRVRNEE